MKDRILAFLTDLDETLASYAREKTLDVYHIGRSSLVWQYDYLVTTKDIDILQPRGEDELIEVALRLFGQGTPKAGQHGLYLEVVNRALPPVPRGFENRATLVPGSWKVLRVYHLEPHDFAATKLKRFFAPDRADIRLLCDLELLDAQRLEAALESAFLFSLDKDGDPLRDRAFQNLRTVQRYLNGDIPEF